ncbi:MAG: type II toxin-antitoxin system RelE/ParE family toxin [Deltaproteobacteria bacterium]|nr:type II toxin-antitoxin system RelE/ParE family toxin [Deltaproteobacteria bacterium]
MLIVETAIFTRRIQALISDEQYRLLQLQLVAQPDVGKVIPQSGGLRKLRWSLNERGKRGGIRVIYYWSAARDTILMLFVYAKNEQDDLTRQQLKTLRKIIEEEYR